MGKGKRVDLNINNIYYWLLNISRIRKLVTENARGQSPAS